MLKDNDIRIKCFTWKKIVIQQTGNHRERESERYLGKSRCNLYNS